jgi:hypothetical protein
MVLPSSRQIYVRISGIANKVQSGAGAPLGILTAYN